MPSWITIADRRIRFRLRFAFLGKFVKSPGRRLSRPDLSIQVALSGSYIADINPWGGLSRRRGCAVGPRVVTTCQPSGSTVQASHERLDRPPSLARMRDGTRLVYPACETRGGRCISFRLILGQGAEVVEWPKFSKGRESEETSAPPDMRLKCERAVW